MKSLACILLAAVNVAAQTPDAAEQAKALAALRDYALNYTDRLPDFLCTQITQRRFRENVRSGMRPQRDLIEEQVTYAGHRESYVVTRLNGKAVKGIAHDQVGGIVSSGEFGSLLRNTFDPRAAADFRWERSATRDGRKVYVFAFRVPETRGYGLVESRGTIRVPYKGQIFADARTGAVMRVEMECEIPVDSEYKRLELTLDYKPAEVAGREFILPVHFHMRTRRALFATVINETVNEADYTDYRRFDADSSVSFDDAAKP
jgi:hypothetical protein